MLKPHICAQCAKKVKDVYTFYCYHNQKAMAVINYQDQLQSGTFENAVHYLIKHKLDLSVFHPKYRNDATGRLAPW
ncbi:hypothetical protein [Halomonas sp. SpR8]|uniref:hypothetical protein n=1 Tax=Halomonas sp. SpR8 TaxID=3050463 RepID=UPI0027E5B8EC|nr:hypothetical protein [Halomonas sp. SpR8]MDQ7730726.1 hypothetical protein [Halomonas sp. SpR8]